MTLLYDRYNTGLEGADWTGLPDLIQLIYFGIAGAAFAIAGSLLIAKYVTKSQRAKRDRGAYLTFALFMGFAGLFALMLAVVS